MPKKTETDKTEEKEQTAEESVAAGTCPECGESLEGRDAAAHVGAHWRGQGDAAPKEGTKAYERQQALLGKEE